jgi:glycosyltransferase involved in cell wall biosynthesis
MKIKKKKINVAVGIIAFNEEKNIRELLLSILEQSQSNFTLENIILVSDGSSDRTVAFARSIKSDKISVLDSKIRQGKSSRLNQLFKISQAEILVLFDGDVLPKGKKVIEKLVNGFTKNVHLVGGEIVSVASKTVSEKIHNQGNLVWRYVKENINNGANIWNSQGAILALSKRLSKSFYIPEKIESDDCFIYLQNVKNNYKFSYIKEAKVIYKAPDSFQDYLKSHGRYFNSKEELRRYFPLLIEKEYFVPLQIKSKAYILAFYNYPLLTIGFFAMELIVRLKRLLTKNVDKNYGWEISISTKQKIIL